MSTKNTKGPRGAKSLRLDEPIVVTIMVAMRAMRRMNDAADPTMGDWAESYCATRDLARRIEGIANAN